MRESKPVDRLYLDVGVHVLIHSCRYEWAIDAYGEAVVILREQGHAHAKDLALALARKVCVCVCAFVIPLRPWAWHPCLPSAAQTPTFLPPHHTPPSPRIPRQGTVHARLGDYSEASLTLAECRWWYLQAGDTDAGNKVDRLLEKVGAAMAPVSE
jgi:hypothetical protein